MANDGSGFSEYNEPLQATCYRLALETYWKEPWFYGMYWWKWFSNPADAGKEADPFSPHGRKAEKAIRDFYQQER